VGWAESSDNDSGQLEKILKIINRKLSNIKLITLTQGKFAIVDAEDYDWLSQYKWCAAKDRYTFYAHRGCNGTTVSMHRAIMRAPKG